MRVLHVHSRHVDLQTLRSIAALQQSGGDGTIEHASATIGAVWPILALRGNIRQFDIVHVWDHDALRTALFAGARRTIFTVPEGVSEKHRLSERGVHFVATNAARRAVLAARAHPHTNSHLIRPPLLGSEASAGIGRRAIRQSLGIADDDFVMLAPGESTRAADHERASWAGSILHVVDERYRVLLWGRGPRLRAAATLGDKLRQPGLVIVSRATSTQYEDLFPAADALLVTARAPVPTLPVAMAMAAGVPIVSVPRPELADVLVDNVTAFMVPNVSPRLIAQRVLDLRSDPELTHQITARASDRARELFAADRFITEYGDLYQLVAGNRAAAEFAFSEKL